MVLLLVSRIGGLNLMQEIVTTINLVISIIRLVMQIFSFKRKK